MYHPELYWIARRQARRTQLPDWIVRGFQMAYALWALVFIGTVLFFLADFGLWCAGIIS